MTEILIYTAAAVIFGLAGIAALEYWFGDPDLDKEEDDGNPSP
jgi:hypothetical protein